MTDPALLAALKRRQGYDEGGTVQPAIPSWFNEPTPTTTPASANSDSTQSLTPPTIPAAASAGSVGGVTGNSGGSPGGGGPGQFGAGPLKLGQFTDAPAVPKLDSFTNAYANSLPQGTLSQQQIAQQRAAALQPFIDALSKLNQGQQSLQQPVSAAPAAKASK